MTNGSGFSQSYSPALSSFVRDNVVHDNSSGISANGTIVVSGNTVYGHQDIFGNSFGISTSDYVEAFNNTVYENNVGIRGGGSIHDNRVHGNTTAGIQSFDSSSQNTLFGFGSIYNNTVYSNQIGIERFAFSSSSVTDTIRNNLVYANASQGIYVHGQHQFATTEVLNNTVYQPQGDAILVADHFSNVHLRNNILWAQNGFDISVDPTSEAGFQSDYNNLHTTGSGQIGSWENHPFNRLIDWSYELGLDRHSQSVDPQFVNPAGPDGVLGYSTTTVGAAQILDDKARFRRQRRLGPRRPNGWQRRKLLGECAGCRGFRCRHSKLVIRDWRRNPRRSSTDLSRISLLERQPRLRECDLFFLGYCLPELVC